MTHRQAAVVLLIGVFLGLGNFILGLYLIEYINMLAGVVWWAVVLTLAQTYSLDFIDWVCRRVK